MREAIRSYREENIIDIVEKTISKKDKAILEEFKQYNRATSGENRVIKYHKEVLMILDNAEVPISKFKNKKIIDGIRGAINRSKKERHSKNDLLRTMKRFLRWYFRDLELIEDIKLEGTSRVNEKKINETTLVRPEEAEALIRIAETLRHRAMISLMIETGSRPQEIRTLRWKDIKFNEEYGADISLYSEKVKRARSLPIPNSSIHLKRWKDEYAYPNRSELDLVFPDIRDKTREVGKSFFAHLFKRLCKKGKIRHFHPYMLRHTKLTAMYKKLPEQIVKKFAGHSASSRMAGVYSHIGNEDVKEVVLKEIYNIKEPDPIIKNKLEKEIEDLKKKYDVMAKALLILEKRKKI